MIKVNMDKKSKDFLLNGKTIPEWLTELGKEGNAMFVASLNPGIPHVLGVRLGDMRRLAKQIAASDWEGYLDSVGDYYMEERLLHGLVLGAIAPDKDVEAYLNRVTNFVHQINCWSVCDSFRFAGGKRYFTQHEQRFWEYLTTMMQSREIYTIRFGVVMTLTYYIRETYIDQLLERYAAIRHPDYYVKMAVAWALSVCYVKFPQQTYGLLAGGTLDAETLQKTVRKINESLRVDKASKQLVSQLLKR